MRAHSAAMCGGASQGRALIDDIRRGRGAILFGAASHLRLRKLAIRAAVVAGRPPQQRQRPAHQLVPTGQR